MEQDTVHSIAQGFTLDQWRSVTLYLANFHAWSLITDLEWRSKLPTPGQVANVFSFYVDVVRDGLKPMIKKYGEYFGHIDESIYEKMELIATPKCTGSVDHVLREANEDEVLRLYFEEFNRKSGLSIDFENVQRVYDHLKAIFSLIGVPMTDLMLRNVEKLNGKDSNDDPKIKILSRMKVNYNFAAAYFTSKYEIGLTGL
uniref:Uncharacterized protein n=1 Tax=Romanomermis culicivorax TaxID=13658 RepID=A0A915JJU6_ROMCU